MRSRILSSALVLSTVGLFSSCDLGQSVSEMFNVLSVSFSSADNPVTGPTIAGPSWVNSAALLLLPSYAGGKTKTEVLDMYHLDITFHVKADNSKNSQRASFGQSVRPVLNLRINDRVSSPIQSEMEAFAVEGGQVGSLDFPVQIPLTKIDKTTLGKIVDGDDIPYFLSGTLNFDLMEGLQIKGSGKSEVNLATGALPTRPTGDINLAAMGSKLF